MAKPLKVVGGTLFRKGTQVRVIAAVKSMAEMRRLTGATATDIKHSFCETGNKTELEVALAKPGVVFYTPLTHHSDRDYKELTDAQ